MKIKFICERSLAWIESNFIRTGEILTKDFSIEFDSKELTAVQRIKVLPFVALDSRLTTYVIYVPNVKFDCMPTFDKVLGEYVKTLSKENKMPYIWETNCQMKKLKRFSFCITPA